MRRIICFISANEVFLWGMYIYQYKDWPNFSWDAKRINPKIGEARNLQGRLLGKMEALGFHLIEEAVLETLTTETVKSSSIEGEKLNTEAVRSSVAKRLGMKRSGLPNPGRNVVGVVEMMMDATQKYKDKLTDERIVGWHSALFPDGMSGMNRVLIGQYRTKELDPMQVVSGAIGKEKVHYEAPSGAFVKKEMKAFLKWFNANYENDPLVKAAIAHLWFVSIHPMDDGNGRITRALTEMLLARSDNSNQRFYSMSAQIEKERKQYYNILERTQKRKPEITEWIEWFLDCLIKALKATEKTLAKVFDKARFWDRHQLTEFNTRQKKVILRLQGDFVGKLSTSKWAKICKCSQDTAHRDIKDLISKKVMKQDPGGGRSTTYSLIYPKK